MTRTRWILHPCRLWHIVVVIWRLGPELGVWRAAVLGWTAVWYWYEINEWYDKQDAKEADEPT